MKHASAVIDKDGITLIVWRSNSVEDEEQDGPALQNLLKLSWNNVIDLVEADSHIFNTIDIDHQYTDVQIAMDNIDEDRCPQPVPK